jgi:hypothetical protein
VEILKRRSHGHAYSPEGGTPNPKERSFGDTSLIFLALKKTLILGQTSLRSNVGEVWYYALDRLHSGYLWGNDWTGWGMDDPDQSLPTQSFTVL